MCVTSARVPSLPSAVGVRCWVWPQVHSGVPKRTKWPLSELLGEGSRDCDLIIPRFLVLRAPPHSVTSAGANV